LATSPDRYTFVVASESQEASKLSRRRWTRSRRLRGIAWRFSGKPRIAPAPAVCGWPL